MDRMVGLPRGFAYVEYETRADAERAKLHMDGGQLDGNVITCGPTCWLQLYIHFMCRFSALSVTGLFV